MEQFGRSSQISNEECKILHLCLRVWQIRYSLLNVFQKNSWQLHTCKPRLDKQVEKIRKRNNGQLDYESCFQTNWAACTSNWSLCSLVYGYCLALFTTNTYQLFKIFFLSNCKHAFVVVYGIIFVYITESSFGNCYLWK